MKFLLAPALLVLGSCTHPDAGLYTSRPGDMLRISRSGQLEWSPPSKDFHKFDSVGILAKPDSRGDRHLVMASANPRLGISVHFSPDGRTVEVKWRSFAHRPLPKRETHYRKHESPSKF